MTQYNLNSMSKDWMHDEISDNCKHFHSYTSKHYLKKHHVLVQVLQWTAQTRFTLIYVFHFAFLRLAWPSANQLARPPVLLMASPGLDTSHKYPIQIDTVMHQQSESEWVSLPSITAVLLSRVGCRLATAWLWSPRKRDRKRKRDRSSKRDRNSLTVWLC